MFTKYSKSTAAKELVSGHGTVGAPGHSAVQRSNLLIILGKTAGVPFVTQFNCILSLEALD